MGFDVRQTPEGRRKKPGTCNQTGNNAPKFPWSRSPVGRTARVVALFCANHLGYSDSYMAETAELPPIGPFGRLFLRIMPWFPDHYNVVMSEKVRALEYTGVVLPFDVQKAHHRVRYCFAKPGRKIGVPRDRVYGYSSEHPLSNAQQKPGGRAEVYNRIAPFIGKILNDPKGFITIEQAIEWGV